MSTVSWSAFNSTDKEANYYERLSVSDVFVDSQTIKEAYSAFRTANKDDLEALRLGTEAFDCLDQMRCRDQYTRFGNTLKLEVDTAEYEMDWKMAFSICFYIFFAFAHASLQKVEQKPGLRFGMGIGIMFCANEIQMLSSASA